MGKEGKEKGWRWGWNGDTCAVAGVAIVLGGRGDDPKADRRVKEARAKLISAAPELLEALRRFVNNDRHARGCNGSPLGCTQTCILTRAALDKADGEP